MSAAVSEIDLHGLGVLITRPAHQAGPLCRAIEHAGGHAHAFPTLQIEAPADPAPLEHALGTIAEYDLVVFVSANAVERALALPTGRGSWPKTTRIAAIGTATARALRAHGLEPALCPERNMTSEGLLALSALQSVRGWRVLVVRGNGGREFLAEELRRRGARVEQVEAYRRVRPDTDPAPLLANWRGGAIDVVVLTSNESLQNLVVMLGTLGGELLRATQLLVVSERMATEAARLEPVHPPIVAATATDAAVLAALVDYRRGLGETDV